MNWLKITANIEIIRIPTDDIVFIKGDGNYSDIYLCNGKQENVSSQLGALMSKLSEIDGSIFFRVGKSFIVNKNFIFKVNPGLQKLLLFNSRLEKEIQLKVSKEALKGLKELLEKEGGHSYE